MELDECDLEMFGAKFAKGHMLSNYIEKPDCYIMTGNSNTTINFGHHIHAYRTEANNLNILQLKFNLANEIIAIPMGGMFN